jgi:cell division protein ZapA
MEAGTERKTVRVTIFNQTYTLASTSEQGEIESLAQSVDDLMNKIAAHAANLDSQRVAVLACLNLADQLRAAEKELSTVKKRVDEKARELSTLLDQTVLFDTTQLGVTEVGTPDVAARPSKKK